MRRKALEGKEGSKEKGEKHEMKRGIKMIEEKSIRRKRRIKRERRET